jgi:acyl-coenzyme A synthetase/AMP-(fatty) acid ligase
LNTPTETLPSLAGPAPFAWRNGLWVSREQLCADARCLARQLPCHPYVINLCEDRYLFCVMLLAAMLRGQVSLLPPSGQAIALREILHDYPDVYLASEQAQGFCPWFAVAPPQGAKAGEPLAFADEQTALIAFTSGSTGYPKPCAHAWGSFRISAGLALDSLGLQRRQRLMISTTPPQHMYGLETSIFWPLFSDLAVYAGRPFFPEDARRAIASSPWPSWLATTPTHLRALAKAPGDWRGLAGILSSTAPLSQELARQAELALGAELREIYGSTETLSFASRATARASFWRPYAGARLAGDGQGNTLLASPHLKTPMPLPDLLSLEADGRFQLLGRDDDMLKIGGKRASLAELNRRLAELEGIEDGLFIVREQGQGECRMAAVVVSRLGKQAIREGLRPYLDEVFLPRSIHYVDAIPRNPVGKIIKEQWDALLRRLGY